MLSIFNIKNFRLFEKRKLTVFNIFMIAVFLFGNLNFAVFAQEEESVQGEQQEYGHTPDEIVRKIEIKGLRALTKEYVMGKIRSREGSYFYPSIVKEDIKDLYSTGHFAMINFETKKIDNGIILYIKVQEKPVLVKINFAGYQKIKEKDLKKKIKSSVGSPADEGTIKQDVMEIKSLYISKGYTQVDVNYSLNVNESKNEATLKFVVTEGTQSKVSKISFEGVKAFKYGELLKLMKTKKSSIWPLNVILKTGVLDEEVFSEDIDRLESYYHYKGYLDAKVLDIKRKPLKKNSVEIIIVIEEGPTYNVGVFDIQGNAVFPTKALMNLIKSMPDTLYSPEKSENDKTAIEDFYDDRGYIEARVEPQVIFNSNTNKMDLTFNISEGNVFYINKVNIKGNYKTKDKVIRRELIVYPGEVFNGSKIKTGKDRLDNTGFFEKVNYSMEDSGKDGKKDLVYELEEKKTGALSFGAGYSSIDSVVGFVEVSQSNFDLFNFKNFQGAGQKLRVRFEGGDKRQDFLVSFVEPYFLDKKVSFGFDAFVNKSEYLSSDFNEDRQGVNFSLGKQLGEFNKGTIMFTYERIGIDVDESASPELQLEDGTYNQPSISFKFDRDTRDKILFPTKGAKNTAILKLSGGTESYTRFDFKRSLYIAPFSRFPNHVIQLSGGLGAVGGLSGGRVPIFDRMFLGGPNTVRGFEYRELGPKDINEESLGGKLGVWNSVEYRFPIIERLYGAFFVDEGNVYPKISDMSDQGINVGVGLGVRLNLPIGPMKFDYGIPVIKDDFTEDDAKPRFHFSMGTSF